jgi:hypothetical protein
LQEDNHLLAELQVVMADKAALEDEKAAAQVNKAAAQCLHSVLSMSAWPHLLARCNCTWSRTALYVLRVL